MTPTPTSTPTPIPSFVEPVAPALPPVQAAPAAAQAAAPAATQAEPAAATGSKAFILPTADLQALAESTGLSWVNSDADKIQAAQQAIAAEPKPVHQPRVAKPMAAIDEGPLVLVETRKDLSQIKLPFENGQPSQPQSGA
ncbi:MAG: hypothetical protein ABI564_15115 [Ideonella sp.]